MSVVLGETDRVRVSSALDGEPTVLGAPSNYERAAVERRAVDVGPAVVVEFESRVDRRRTRHVGTVPAGGYSCGGATSTGRWASRMTPCAVEPNSAFPAGERLRPLTQMQSAETSTA